jgi:glycosyltransferase involved in cell wall biosynthesis
VETETETDRILVLVVALNEESGIRPTLVEIQEILNGASVFVVDGGSSDKTVRAAKDCGANVIVQKDEGKGDALKRALPQIDADPKYAVLIDADYTYPAKSIPEMVDILDKNKEVGMVCGNRFNNHFHLGKMHHVLYLGNRMLAFSHNLLNGVQLRDPLTGLRVVRWEILKDWVPKSKGFDVEVELNHLVERKGYGIVEVPIGYRRRLGKKKLKVRDGLSILRRILHEGIQDLVHKV